jgi:hypothetical protein
MKLFTMLSFVLALYCNASSKKESAVHPGDGVLKRVKIESGSFDALYFTQISCDDFGGKMIKKTFSIKNNPTLSLIEKRLMQLKPLRANQTPDVRAKATFYYNNGDSSCLCIGRFAMLWNSKPTAIDSVLLSLIQIRTH